ncbi:Lactate dehydrogenase [Azospirillaceae bacterium]
MGVSIMATSFEHARSLSVMVTTTPFAERDPTPAALLTETGIPWSVNPLGRRLQPREVLEVIRGHSVVIAGTETISGETIAACAPTLKAICRVGIGLDGVDLQAARRHGVQVSYTPDAPAPAGAGLTVGLMLSVLRQTHLADRDLRAGLWKRRTGLRLAECVIGVIGVGRIGRKVIRHILGGFPGVKILAHDIAPEFDLFSDALNGSAVVWTDRETILRQSDIITLHAPSTRKTRGMIAAETLSMMKPGAVLINTARGDLVDDVALVSALENGRLSGAAIDVFPQEPYSGPLQNCRNLLLTCHMGSMTVDCRARMEIEATQEAVRVLLGRPLLSSAPNDEIDDE